MSPWTIETRTPAEFWVKSAAGAPRRHRRRLQDADRLRVVTLVQVGAGHRQVTGQRGCFVLSVDVLGIEELLQVQVTGRGEPSLPTRRETVAPPRCRGSV